MFTDAMTGCAKNEVVLRALPEKACFELTLTHDRAIRGVVVKHLAGSTLVNCGTGKQEHWNYDCPVIPFLKENPETWIQTQKEEIGMAKKAASKRVIRFAIDKEEPLEKYLDVKNTSYSALMYRAIKKAKKPVTFAEIWGDIYRSVGNKTEGKTPKATLYVILQKMVKDGTVARSESKEEAKFVAA